MYGELSHLSLDGQLYLTELEEHRKFTGEIRQLIASGRIVGLSVIDADGADFAFRFCDSVFKVTHRFDGTCSKRKFFGMMTRYSCFDADCLEPLGQAAEWEVFRLYGREPNIRYSGLQCGSQSAIEMIFPSIVSDLLWPETKVDSPEKRQAVIEQFHKSR